MPEELVVITNPSTANSRRARYWIKANGPVPPGQVIDVSCGDRLCIDLAHCFLRAKKETHKYTEYRDRLRAIDVDEWFDVLNPPVDIVKFRIGLNAICGRIKFALRSWPSGRLQIIKLGLWPTWGEEWTGSNTAWATRQQVPKWRRPHCFFLGFMRNYGEKFWRPPKCSIRACPYPTYNHAGQFCYQHNRWFDFKMSMTDRGFSPATMLWTPRAKYAPWELAAEYLTKTDNLEKTLKFTLAAPKHRNQFRDERHKNAGAIVLETAPAEKPRKRVSLDVGPVNYSRSNGRLRMRLGGGSHHGSKTTAGRKRAASRAGPGSRHSTKEKRWNRETIEALEREADKLLGITPEVRAKAEEMRVKQECEMAIRTYPLCQSYEILEPDLTEEEERESRASQIEISEAEFVGESIEGG